MQTTKVSPTAFAKAWRKFCLVLLVICSSSSAALAGPVYLPLILNGPGSPTEVLQNGDFEKGRDGFWKEFSTPADLVLIQFTNDLGVFPQGGSWAAWLGQLDGHTTRLSQTITVPANAANLNFYYLIKSLGGPATCWENLAFVKFNGADLTPPYELCGNMFDWTLARIPITGFRGQTVELMFEVVNNSFLASDFYVDTVSISP
jgi:hypothetical protein